jgi:hypothetical protein
MRAFTDAFPVLTEWESSFRFNNNYIWYRNLLKIKKMEGQVQKDNTRLIIALVIIGIGFIWLLQKLTAGLHLSFPWFTHHLFTFRPVFMNIGKIIFSWQLILILVGIILLAGRRSSGIVLIVLGGLFLIPKLLAFQIHTIPFLIPLVLVAVGVTLIIKANRR